MREVIRFRRLSQRPAYIPIKHVKIDGTIEYEYPPIPAWHWEVAFNEQDLWQKLDGEMAEIIMPAKAWYIRLWRKIIMLMEGNE